MAKIRRFDSILECCELELFLIIKISDSNLFAYSSNKTPKERQLSDNKNDKPGTVNWTAGSACG